MHRAKVFSQSLGASTSCVLICVQLTITLPVLLILPSTSCVMLLAYCSQVVTAPMSTLNAIAMEAYKKYILVSLIHHGQVCFAPLLFWYFYGPLAYGENSKRGV